MISAVIIAKNEEENIKNCILGLKWCDEILVIDDNSLDKTAKIAKEAGAKVIKHPLNNDFASQRNFALKEAKHDWIFFVDADEVVTPKLAGEIQKALSSAGLGKIARFYFKRDDYFLGKLLKYGETSCLRVLRLGRRGGGNWTRKVDEVWEISGQTKTFKNPLLHYSHSNLTQFLEIINNRSTLNAEEFYLQGKKLTFFESLKPFLKFIQNYFFRLGVLDGVFGFVFAVLMSLHSFLVRGKLYLLWKKGGGWHEN